MGAMPTYAFRDRAGDLILNAPEYGMPIPAHAQTPGALAAVASVAAAGAERRLAVIDANLVTEHGHAPVKPYDKPVVCAAARRLVALAASVGMRTNVVELADRCAVEGIDPAAGIAFRMVFVRGRAERGAWHERHYRYVLVEDARLVGVNKISRTGLAGKRPAGVGTTRLKCVASPVGIPMSVTEIESRLRALG